MVSLHGGSVGLKFDPMGGGQFKQLVAQMIEAEKLPIKSLESRKGIEQARLKLFQDFKGKVGSLSKSVEDIGSISKLREFKVDLGDGKDLVDVTIDKEKAMAGTYEVQVDQLAARSSMISRGFKDPEEPNLGMGFVVFQKADGSNFELFVDEKESSLRNIATKINKTEGAPVQASVIKDIYDADKPWKLIVTAKQDGEPREVTFPEFYFMDGNEDFWIDDKKGAQNAFIKLDGFSVDLESNDTANFLEGINLHLKQSRPDKPFMIKVSEDHQKVGDKIKGVVDQINGVLEFINKQNAVDKDTDTKATFAGDTSLQTMEYRLRNLLHEGFPYWPNPEDDKPQLVWMHELGVTLGRNGLLSYNDTKFNKAMEENFDRTAEAITGEYGFAAQLKQVLQSFNDPATGMMSTREKGLRARIKSIDDNIANKERAVEQKAQAITDRFSRLQGTLANLQRQQASIGAMGGGGGGGGMISQLLGG